MSRVLRTATRWFFPLGISSSLAVAIAVALYVDTAIGVRGLYAAVGLSIGALFYYWSPPSDSWMADGRHLRWCEKGVYLTAIVAVGSAAVLDERLLMLVTLLPVGCLLIALQLRAERSPYRLLPQLTVLFSMAPLWKYLTNHFYFGNGDILFHVLHVNQVLSRGSVSAIQGPVDQYRFLPGLHLLVGGVSLITDLPAYDSLLLTGILVYAVIAIAGTYLLGGVVFGREQLALCAAFAVSFLYSVSFYSTYFFPQSLAILLLLLVVVTIWRIPVSLTSDFANWTAVTFVLLLGVLFTHHLSFLLVLPLVALLMGGSVVHNADRQGLKALVPNVRVLPLAAGLLVGVTYWTEVLPSFIFGVFWALRRIFLNLFATTEPTGTDTRILAFGKQLPDPSLDSALSMFFSVNVLYLVLLVAVFSLGVATMLERRTEFRQFLPLSLTGIFSGMLLLRTPLRFPGMDRVRLPFAFFFALVCGIGIYSLIVRSRTRSYARVLSLSVLVVTATACPLYVLAGDDLYDLHDPPDGPPQKQVEFSATEYRALESVREFEDEQNLAIQSYWIDGLALSVFGVREGPDMTVTSQGLHGSAGTVVYRTRWSDHRIHSFGDGGSFVVSERWLTHNVRESNKVYATGEAGVIWDNTRINLTSTPGPETEGN